MNLNELKKINKPEEVIVAEETLLKPYKPIVMAIPKEHWEAITYLLTEQSKSNLIIQNAIVDLPTWSNINEILLPNLNILLNAQNKKFTENKNNMEALLKSMNASIEENIKNNVQSLIAIQTKEMNAWANAIISKLQARDLSPTSQRFKWVGIGALIPIVLFGIFALFR